MATIIEADDLETLYRRVVYEIGWHPELRSSPRGMETRERLAVTLVLKNPRARIIASAARKVDYAFAAAEFLWYWQGRSDLAFLTPYNKRMAEFSNDGVSLNSAYGARIFGKMPSQWSSVIDELVRDPNSRRAVLQIYGRDDLYEGNKDVPCTLSLQFLLRDGRLHAHVVMRSNDVFWGLPYDVFSFTLLQECAVLALRESGVECELGTYTHTAGSLHVYERHFEKVEQILEETRCGFPEYGGFQYGETPRLLVPDPMPPITSLDALWNVCRVEIGLVIGIAPDSGVPGPWTGEGWLEEQIRHKWLGGFRRPLRCASPDVRRFDCGHDDDRLIACEDNDP